MASYATAAAYLGTSTQTVTDFRKADLLGSVKSQLGVSLDDLRRFKERYVLSGEIVERGGAGWFGLTEKLEAEGIRPAREWPATEGRPGRRIYDRMAIEALERYRPVMIFERGSKL